MPENFPALTYFAARYLRLPVGPVRVTHAAPGAKRVPPTSAKPSLAARARAVLTPRARPAQLSVCEAERQTREAVALAVGVERARCAAIVRACVEGAAPHLAAGLLADGAMTAAGARRLADALRATSHHARRHHLAEEMAGVHVPCVGAEWSSDLFANPVATAMRLYNEATGRR